MSATPEWDRGGWSTIQVKTDDCDIFASVHVGVAGREDLCLQSRARADVWLHPPA